MNFTYENQGTSTFLVYEMTEKDTVDGVSLGMLTNNHIPGLAPALFSQMDDRRCVKYNVSSKISVKQMFSSPITKKRILGILGGITEALLSVEEYMLNPSSLILDSEYIFADVTTGSAVMICLPLEEYTSETNPCQYLKSIVFGAQFEAAENNEYVAKLITYLNNSSSFTLEGFKKLLQEIETAAPSGAAAVSAKTVAAPVMQPVVQMPQSAAQMHSAVNLQPVSAPAQQTTTQKPAASQVTYIAPNTAKPVAKTAAKAAVKPETSAVAADAMSLGYLLQHYSKENKAIYDAQKAERKASGAGSKTAKAKPVKGSDGKTKPEKKTKTSGKTGKKAAAAQQPSFAIPGQAAVITPGISSAGGSAVPKTVPAPVHITPVAPAPAASAAPVTPAASVKSAAPAPAPVTPLQPSAPLNFGETTVLSSPVSGETTVLNGVSAQVSVRPTLVRRKTGETIPVSKAVFRIGKEQSFVDYCISGNSAVSRCHANIITKNGQYYVVDTNSTNHTYVDNKMIQSNAEQQITDGSVIRFANEEFEFRLYV